MGLVVADGRKDGNIREVVFDHLDSLPDDVQVAFPGGVPDIMGHQITRPDDEVYILKGQCVWGHPVSVESQTEYQYTVVIYVRVIRVSLH